MISGTILVTMIAFLMSCGKSSNDYPIKSIPFSRVQVNDDFWSSRIQTNREITIPYAFNHYKESGLINNFRMAAGLATGEQAGNYPFDDTDVYKTIEGASHLLAVQHDPNLDRFLDSLITTIAAAQEDDGYIYTARTNESGRFRRSMGETRWSRLGGSHELYNAGHLYEAAYAHFQATGSRKLLDVALKNADLVLETFGPDKIQSPPGHQEIELGLVKLYRLTDNRSYLDLAKFFLDERGKSRQGRELWGEYAQDHRPVVEQDEAVGHAVRAPYMYSAMADIVALTGNKSYRKALDVLWDNVVTKKLHVTGGVGAVGLGESFGGNYDLPNMTAYNETCSSIANIMWNHRMFLLTGKAQYIDVLERTLYNAFLSGVSLNGNLFFYDNPLASRGQHQRTPWLYCACCISNVTRFFPNLPEYVFAWNEDGIFVNLFVGSKSSLEMLGINVGISQETRYPWDGKVEILVNPDEPAPFDIYIRIPGWARNKPVPGDLYRFKDEHDKLPTIKINKKMAEFRLNDGYVRLSATWKRGDKIELDLPMPVRQLRAHREVVENTGKMVLQRGPLVYCVEGVDQKNGNALNLVFDKNAAFDIEFRESLLNGVSVIFGNALSSRYDESGTIQTENQDFIAIPYFGWAHRGNSEMMVWLPTDITAAKPLDGPSIASMSIAASSSGGKGLEALNDQRHPAQSNDKSVPVFVWESDSESVWVEYRFRQPEEISETQVFWYDDPSGKRFSVPKSWRLRVLFDGEWRSVWNNRRQWGTKKDQFNKMLFETVKTTAARLEVVLQPGKSTGIFEWRIY